MNAPEVTGPHDRPQRDGCLQAPRAISVAAARSVRIGGFTIIELLIVMAIAGVLAVIAVPSMRDMVYNMRLRSANGLIISDLNLARGEAIKRNTRVLICVRNAAGTDCAAGTNWQAGWVVCYDDDRDGDCDDPTGMVPPNPNPIAVRPALDPTLTLVASVAVLGFSPNSTVTTAADFALSGVWTGAVPRKVCILGTGNTLVLPAPPASQVCPL